MTDFQPAADAPDVYLTVCATCLDSNCGGEAGLGGGEKIYALLERQMADHPFRSRFRLRKRRCLMACSDGCVLAIASTGKMKYLLGRLPASEDAAAQVLDFAALYCNSETGVTPNHAWPGTIGMNFLGCIPPTDSGEGDWEDEGSDL